MSPHHDAKEICCEISAELRDVAAWMSSGQLTPEQFRNTVLELERAKVTRYGFALSGTVRPDRSVEFALIFGDTGDVCARLTFDPVTGELATEHLCT